MKALNRTPPFALRLLIAFALVVAFPVQGQNAPAPTPAADADIDATAQANLYFRLGNMTSALPLYERLATQDPKNALFAERHAYCLMVKALLLPTGKERTDLMKRAKQQAERAQALGDNSPLLQMTLESTTNPANAKQHMESRMAAAEAAFSKGDHDTALKAYLEIAESDPTSYEARLYIGDVYYLKGQTQLAGEWFQKAIDLQPNRETAYRYWGDALLSAGRREEALPKFIDAVVAEPYSRRPWLGLQQWAQRSGVTIKPPHIQTPPAPTLKNKDDEKSGVVIHISEEALKNPDGTAVWLAYSASRANWRGEEFAQQYPNEKKYRHTLAEEVDALKGVVTVLGELKTPEEKLDENIRTLLALSKAEMIEPYVLLNAADEGIAQDYDAYRNAHRDVVRTYISEHVLHREDAKK
jgi:tetratricopeptide (TPR) repeat protein